MVGDTSCRQVRFFVFCFNHTVFTLIRVWQDLNNRLRLRASRLDGGAPSPLPFVPVDKWELNWEKDTKERKKKKRERLNPATAPNTPDPRALSPLPAATSVWVETSRLQLPPGSSSPLGRTLLWKTAQRYAHVNICLHSSSWPSAPPSTVHSGDLFTGCSGGRGAPASGKLSLHTTITCRPLGGRTFPGKLPWSHDWTSVGRT